MNLDQHDAKRLNLGFKLRIYMNGLSSASSKDQHPGCASLQYLKMELPDGRLIRLVSTLVLAIMSKSVPAHLLLLHLRSWYGIKCYECC